MRQTIGGILLLFLSFSPIPILSSVAPTADIYQDEDGYSEIIDKYIDEPPSQAESVSSYEDLKTDSSAPILSSVAPTADIYQDEDSYSEIIDKYIDEPPSQAESVSSYEDLKTDSSAPILSSVAPTADIYQDKNGYSEIIDKYIDEPPSQAESVSSYEDLKTDSSAPILSSVAPTADIYQDKNGYSEIIDKYIDEPPSQEDADVKEAEDFVDDAIITDSLQGPALFDDAVLAGLMNETKLYQDLRLGMQLAFDDCKQKEYCDLIDPQEIKTFLGELNDFISEETIDEDEAFYDITSLHKYEQAQYGNLIATLDQYNKTLLEEHFSVFDDEAVLESRMLELLEDSELLEEDL